MGGSPLTFRVSVRSSPTVAIIFPGGCSVIAGAVHSSSLARLFPALAEIPSLPAEMEQQEKGVLSELIKNISFLIFHIGTKDCNNTQRKKNILGGLNH